MIVISVLFDMDIVQIETYRAKHIYNVNDCFLIKEGINGSLILQFSESNKTKKYIIMHFKRSTINTKCVLDNKDVKNFKNAIWK